MDPIDAHSQEELYTAQCQRSERSLVKFSLGTLPCECKVKVNFLMVGHTHEAVDQLFNKFSEALRKQNTLTLSPPKVHEISKMYDIRKWVKTFCEELHGLTTPHVFKIEMAPSGKVVLRYKHWSSDKTEKCKPEDENPENWITLIKERVGRVTTRSSTVGPASLEKMELESGKSDLKKFYSGSRLFGEEKRERREKGVGRVTSRSSTAGPASLEKKRKKSGKSDLKKFYSGSRLFGEEEKKEWEELMSSEHNFFSPKVRSEEFDLKALVTKKQEQTKEQLPCTREIADVRPAAVPDEVELEIQKQFDSIKPVYSKPYRPPTTVLQVMGYEQLKEGDLVAVNVANYDKIPCISKVVELRDQEFVIEWWKGTWLKSWEVWPGCEQDVLPFRSILLYAFELDDRGRLSKDTRKNLKNAYRVLNGTYRNIDKSPYFIAISCVLFN
ncbi:predicted protein [Nematostella vectensis]|uniref:DUF7869 domain-containing protein n=1 Tax=Nematostella vectensis TaxID=45351 RepID=A7RN06_NEMVE|nr:predicted protein [Nematostella vectensis]|eukprot:XP_001639252.1 predicted protein [Nematostella vectensis]